MASMYAGSGQKKYRPGFKAAMWPDTLGEPDKLGGSKFVFVCSMGDLFHPDVTDEFRLRVFAQMRRREKHTFMVLTKRSHELVRWEDYTSRWPLNVWAGVTVEDCSNTKRLDDLRRVPARVRFVSFEPLLSDIDPDLSGIQWAIIGGETGRNVRRMKLSWAENLIARCHAQGVDVWLKQLGSRHESGAKINGKTWKNRPKPLRKQQSFFD
jgi:protein gp37